MNVPVRFPGLLLAVTMLTACSVPVEGTDDAMVELNPVESFDAAADAPASLTFNSLPFQSPWGYGKAENASRAYPLFVSGYWNEGEGQYGAVAQRFPAFVLSYQQNSESAGRTLGEWITAAIAAGYRIDPNRVYLTGFSMGGSGSYPLARGMQSAGRYFAAIIRVAGQSESDLRNEIAAKTAVWYHIGLEDTATRVEVARNALEHQRSYACNATAVETSVSDTMGGYARTTVTLARSGVAMFRYSEYENMGHSSGACYQDPELLAWLFSHTLKNR